MLREDIQASAAWRSLSPVARCVWIEVVRRYAGHNNGDIPLSCREAAGLVNSSPKSAARAFKELQATGFLKVGALSGFNQKGGRRSTRWALTHESLNGTAPTAEWRQWMPNQNLKRGVTRDTQTDLACHQNHAKTGPHAVACHQGYANPVSPSISVSPGPQYIDSTMEGASPKKGITREQARQERLASEAHLNEVLSQGEPIKARFYTAVFFCALVLQHGAIQKAAA